MEKTTAIWTRQKAPTRGATAGEEENESAGAARVPHGRRGNDDWSAGEDPRSGPGRLRLDVATMLRNVVAAAAAGEDPWSGPGE